MALSNTYRIIHCQEYNAERQLRSEWWEVECFKSKWWSLGKRWFAETQALWSSGGDFDVHLRFDSEQKAFDYIGRISTNVPKQTVVRTPVSSYI